jgi:sulfur-oxidizing protein SoxY
MTRLIAMAALMIACAAAGLAPRPAAAQTDEAVRRERWDELRHAIFQQRAVDSGLAALRIEAPPRALDAALVPVTVTYAGADKVTALYLIVDGNPSPLAGTFRFGPAADMHELRTRLRVDQYTLIHAVAEFADGRLIAADAFVKAAGGCSAPASGDPALAMRRMGQMRLRVQGEAVADRPVTAELLVSHPNANGMQMDPLTRLYTPARYVRSVRISFGEEKILDLDGDISLSEDPAFTFTFIPRGAGPLHVEVDDSRQTVFRHDFDVPVRGS